MNKVISSQLRFLSARDVLSLPKLSRCQDLEENRLKQGAVFRHKIFVSHRWESDDDADPHGEQLAGLQRLLKMVEEISARVTEDYQLRLTTHGPVIAAQIFFRLLCGPEDCDEELGDALDELGVWYDFSCLPQAPRSPLEEEAFVQTLRELPAMLHERDVTTLILRSASDDYEDRAWCFAEAALSANKDSTNGPLQFWPSNWNEPVLGINEKMGFMTLIEQTTPGLMVTDGPVSRSIGWSRQLTMQRCVPVMARLLAEIEALVENGELDMAASAQALLKTMGLTCRDERDSILLPFMLARAPIAFASSGTLTILKQAADRFADRLPLVLRRVNGELEWLAPPSPPP